MEKEAKIRRYNDTLLEMAQNGELEKVAASVNDITRNILREQSFTEDILTPRDIQNDQLNKGEDPELLVKWVDREPDGAPATVVPFGTVPDGFTFKGTRYPVYFSRYFSGNHMKDIDRLRGYDYDIREVMTKIAVYNLAAKIDSTFITKCQNIVGTKNTNNALNGLSLPQYISLSGGITRQNMVTAFQAFQRLKVPFGPMQADGGESRGCMLMNNVTAMEFLKMERSEVGGDKSQDMFVGGKTTETIMGVKTRLTIKRDIIPDNEIWLFSSEDYLGKYFRLQPLTTFMKKEGFLLNWWLYTTIGMSIGNVKGVFRVVFE